MHALIERLLAEAPVVTDGAWGTQLQAGGLEVGQCPDGWNLSHPERVEEVARAYVEAGSRIIITNTFRATRFGLKRYGLADQVAEINRAGVEISRKAAAGQAYVFASMGPSGETVLPGETASAELEEAFAEQARALAEAGADALLLETMSGPPEALAAVAAARATGLPVVACMSFYMGKDRDRTMMGTAPEEAAQCLAEAGAEVIGSNCGQGIEGLVAVAKRLKAAADRPIWIKANAGMPEVVDGQTVWTQTPEQFASYVPALVEAGADFIGGCCGTTPEFIRAVGQQVEAVRKRPP